MDSAHADDGDVGFLCVAAIERVVVGAAVRGRGCCRCAQPLVKSYCAAGP